MASSTLRPHRSPSPSPGSGQAINPNNPAKLTRQSLGPPTTSGNSSAARGFGALGTSPGSSSGFSSQPRHVSSSVAMGLGSLSNQRDSLSPRPATLTGRTVSGSSNQVRPSSEFLPTGAARDQARTPEAEQIDQWFKHLASWEATLEEMAAASTDQNFTEELGAIEQWFRVLSEAERTAALYSLLQHSTSVQIRFFLSVLHHMAQADPMTAMLSPGPAAGPAAAAAHSQMDSKLAGMGLKSPSAGGGGAGFAGSPTTHNYLAPESALDSVMSKPKIRQNRISAPGTLTSSNESRWSSNLDQVIERGPSPGLESVRSRSPQPDMRPKSTDFAGGAGAHDDRYSSSSATPRLSAGPGSLGLGFPGSDQSPNAASPLLNPSGNWSSIQNTPMNLMFNQDNKNEPINAALSFANLQLAAGAAAAANRVQLDDARKYRRPGGGTTAPSSRNVSGASAYGDDDGRTSPLPPSGNAFGWNSSGGNRSGGDFGGLGLGDPNLANLNMNLANLNLAGMNPLSPNAMQVLALAQAQQVAQAAQGLQAAQLGQYGGLGQNLNAPRPSNRVPSGRRSPMLGHKAASPGPAGPAAGGGGAGGGAGVAGPDDVDQKVLEDVSTWLRVLRLHKYTTNFEHTKWRDMVMMNEGDLERYGVAAQGARSKFLKVFYNVRTKFDIPHPPGQEEYAPTKE
ncbi:hypothetical protein CcaverHIS002_0206440 [Cutaneotrichosporon cavernicola]|uniref:SAM domain-containing protein n=1 Tax=Cutaneotrichosporon cavernicola TaxID=279322 RepID=A0AA48I445_9TREE|nr:uncharacterized protein CcaverHIS019_0206410 [Cutaneotrichosporon cavernicola]BEI81484.1 hypothetical protein CcaverHIS002_0206440 [Cutaneotrichosporon cavernicola]BEI89279.1 hypothetical protein CcaverHIS019_0206410 [Cutaneotrichosporon cavernicola]